MVQRSPIINVMAKAAQKAGRKLVRDFGEVENLQVSMKGPADFVSAADKSAEEILHRELSEARPGYGFLMEEAGAIVGTNADNRWIIDPLDGTTNFLHGIPHFAISIALEREGDLIAGLIYQPVSDEMFWAERGQGARLNGHRLRVSARRRIEDSVIATGIAGLDVEAHAVFQRELAAVMGIAAGVRRFGAAALDLAYVAAGRFDGFWESALHPWDIAAGIVLVREAGGFVSDMTGKGDMLKTGGVLATNDHLQTPLSKILRQSTAA